MSIGVRLCDLGRSYVSNVRLNVFQHKRLYKNMILPMVVVRKEKPFASFIKCSCKICRRADVTHICYTNVVWAMRFVWFCYTFVCLHRGLAWHLSRANTNCFIDFKPSPGGSHRAAHYPLPTACWLPSLLLLLCLPCMLSTCTLSSLLRLFWHVALPCLCTACLVTHFHASIA